MLSSNDERAGGDGSPLDLSGWETDQRRVGAESIQQSLARLAALPEEQAEVVLLRVLGRLTPLDVADIIGTPPATVRGLEQDGLQRLRRGPALAAVKSGHAEG
jgi:DNA-directed RNA polymerase specialized sigma24 family protein